MKLSIYVWLPLYIFGIVLGFILGIQYDKYQIVIEALSEAPVSLNLNLDTTKYDYLQVGFNFGECYRSVPFSMKELKGLAYEKIYPGLEYNPWLEKAKKESLSNIPHGKIDLSLSENKADFQKMIQKFRSGEK